MLSGALLNWHTQRFLSKQGHSVHKHTTNMFILLAQEGDPDDSIRIATTFGTIAKHDE